MFSFRIEFIYISFLLIKLVTVFHISGISVLYINQRIFRDCSFYVKKKKEKKKDCSLLFGLELD